MRRLKRVLLIAAILLTTVHYGYGQSNTNNYFKSYKALVPLVGDLQGINEKTSVETTVTYFDGLGRPIQVIKKQNSPSGYDLVQFFQYDRLGRQPKTFLPYSSTGTDGSLKVDSEDSQSDYYESALGPEEGPWAYSVTRQEVSELGRTLKQGSPGLAWQPNSDKFSLDDHSVKQRSRMNAVGEVLRWMYDETNDDIHANLGAEFRYYDPNVLRVNETFDESNNLVITYTDIDGKVVLKRVQATSSQTSVDNTNFASTYYVYDQLGRLVAVLPPEATKMITE